MESGFLKQATLAAREVEALAADPDQVEAQVVRVPDLALALDLEEEAEVEVEAVQALGLQYLSSRLRERLLLETQPLNSLLPQGRL